jgi:signal transduction histidine kinase/ActR/RegA family two-component response regulator
MRTGEDSRTEALEREVAERARAEQAEHQRAVRLQLLADVGQKTTAILSRDELLRSAVHIIRETFQYFMVNIFLVDGDDLVLRACTMPLFAPHVNKLRLRIGGEGITAWVAAHGRTANVPDVRRDPRYRFELQAELRTRSELTVPITLQGVVNGVLDVQSETDGAFGELDEFTLQTVAGQLAVAIENARLYEELRRELGARERTERLLRALHEAGLAMDRAPSPGAVFSTVGDELRKTGILCALHLIGEQEGAAHPAYTSPGMPSLEGTSAATVISLATQEVYGAIARGGAARFLHGFCVAPLLFEDRLLGFLTVYSEDLTQDDIPALRIFADGIATAWRKAQLVEDLGRSLRELSATQEQLLQSQKMEAVGRLAGGVAHDFNNQLTAIMGYAEILLEASAKEDPRRADLTEILKAASHAADLTRQLLAFSRKQVLRPQVVDLNALLLEMRTLLRRLLGEDVQLDIRCAPEPVSVKADPTQIQQVIMNLAVNSRDAMPNGGALVIETRRARAAEPGGASGDWCVISVSDTGTGMGLETLSRLYEPYFTTKETGKGTGLGLSTAYGIVRQSGGHIACTSELGKGTTFTIQLPATNDTPAAAGPSRAAPPAAGTETVLVVEDESAVRALVCHSLAAAGYRVLQAATGVEAMEILRAPASQVQMVLTDLVLPGGVSGLDIARWVLEARPDIRLLCVSGYSEQLVAGAEAVLPRGAFLQKPFSPSDLLARMRAILDAHVAAPGS